MSNNSKWELGAVKLTTGEDARILYVQETSFVYRYIGMVCESNGRLDEWKPISWTDKGLEFPYCTEESRNLVPTPKKTVRVRGWMNVNADGSIELWEAKERANEFAHISRVALRFVDLGEVEEGEGL